MESTTSTITSLVLVALIGVGGIYFAYRHIKRKRKISHLPEKVPSASVSPVSLSSIAKFFKGNMNPLSSIDNDYDEKCSAVLFDNLYQIVDGHGDDNLNAWKDSFFANRESWSESEYKQKARMMRGLLIQCGIACVREETIEWSEELNEKYNKLMPLKTGQRCKVIAPYWTFEHHVFEKGIVTKL